MRSGARLLVRPGSAYGGPDLGSGGPGGGCAVRGERRGDVEACECLREAG